MLFHEDLILQIGIKRVIGKLAVKCYQIIESAIRKLWFDDPLVRFVCILPDLIAGLLARNRSCIRAAFPLSDRGGPSCHSTGAGAMMGNLNSVSLSGCSLLVRSFFGWLQRIVSLNFWQAYHISNRRNLTNSLKKNFLNSIQNCCIEPKFGKLEITIKGYLNKVSPIFHL